MPHPRPSQGQRNGNFMQGSDIPEWNARVIWPDDRCVRKADIPKIVLYFHSVLEQPYIQRWL
jgi:hypothetical protein